MGGRGPGVGGKGDTPSTPETRERADKPQVTDWNVKFLERFRRRDVVLSDDEKRERQRIAQPQDGFGYAHGSSRLAPEQKERFLNQLSPDKLSAFKNPDTIVVITSLASRTGSKEVNQHISDNRANEVHEFLKSLPGFAAQVKIESMGEESAMIRGAPDGKDNHHDRVALVDIIEAKKEQPKDKPLTLQKALDKAQKVLQEKPPQSPEVGKRLKGLVEKLRDAKVDDSYIPGRIVFYQDQPHLRPPLKDVVVHARSKLQESMSNSEIVHEGHGQYERKPARVETLLSRLERLDEDIISGQQMANRNLGIQGASASKWLVEVSHWIKGRQLRPDSILSVYK